MKARTLRPLPPLSAVDPRRWQSGVPSGLRDRALLVLARHLDSRALAGLRWRSTAKVGRELVIVVESDSSSSWQLRLVGEDAVKVWAYTESHRPPDGSLFGLSSDSIRSRLSRLRRKAKR